MKIVIYILTIMFAFFIILYLTGSPAEAFSNNDKLYSQVVRSVGANRNTITRISSELDQTSQRAQKIMGKLKASHHVSTNNNTMMKHSSTQPSRFVKPQPKTVSCVEGFSQANNLLEKQSTNEINSTQLGGKVVTIKNTISQIITKLKQMNLLKADTSYSWKDTMIHIK